MYHVYSHCVGHSRYLRTEFSGSRYQCERFIKNRVRQGLPTHYMFISKLDYEAACRRYE